MERREFVAGVGAAIGLLAAGGSVRLARSEGDLLRPPGGQDEDRLIGACIRCDRCRSACPRGCVRPASLEDGLIDVRTPLLDFARGYCDFCADRAGGPRCAEVCPTSALASFDVERDRIGLAQVDEDACVNCGKCVPACGFDALSWDGKRRVPVVDEDACNGCGQCEHVCPSASFGYYDGARERAIRVRCAR